MESERVFFVGEICLRFRFVGLWHCVFCEVLLMICNMKASNNHEFVIFVRLSVLFDLCFFFGFL